MGIKQRGLEARFLCGGVVQRKRRTMSARQTPKAGPLLYKLSATPGRANLNNRLGLFSPKHERLRREVTGLEAERENQRQCPEALVLRLGGEPVQLGTDGGRGSGRGCAIARAGGPVGG